MDLREWAEQFLVRNAKLKGWKVSADGEHYLVETSRRQRYVICERLEEVGEADVVITLNSEENLRWASERFDSLPETRIIFVNPAADAYWTLNVRMLRVFGEPERFIKKPKSLSSDVPIIS